MKDEEWGDGKVDELLISNTLDEIISYYGKQLWEMSKLHALQTAEPGAIVRAALRRKQQTP